MVIFNHHLIFWKSLAFPYSIYSRMTMYIYIVIYIIIIIVDWPAQMGKMRYTSYYIYIYIYMVDMDIMLVCMVILTNTDGFDGRGWPESGTPFQSCLKGHFAGFPLYLWLRKHMIFCRFSWKPLHESAVSPDFDVFCKSPRRESSMATVAIGQVSQRIRLSSC